MDGILGIVLLVFAVGFFLRAANHFTTDKKQKDEIIALLKDIRNALVHKS